MADGRGGARPGSGRPRKVRDRVEINEHDSLAFLKSVMTNNDVDISVRVRAAISAAQYEHTRTHDGGKKDAKARAAEAASSGKFSSGKAPLRVVNE